MATDEEGAPSAALLPECRAAYDRWRRFAEGRAGTLAMFAWAVAEATVWPIIPDFLLAPLAAVNRRFYLTLAACILGAALGGAALFMLAALAPALAYAVLRHLPLVHERQIAAAGQALAASGARAYFAQPWSGIPFKVWGVVGGAAGIAPWQAIPAFVFARALRMASVAVVARLLGASFATFARDFSLFLAAIYAVLFFYGWWQVVG